MNIRRLKIGQKVWVHNMEFPMQETIEELNQCTETIVLSNGHEYTAEQLFSTKSKCKKAN